MKTKQIQFILALFLCLFVSNFSSAQSLLDNSHTSGFDQLNSLDLGATLEPVDIRDLDSDIDLNAYSTDLGLLDSPKSIAEYDEATQVAAVFVQTMLAFGAGFGFGNDETLYCFHAAYYMRFALMANSALYGSLGAIYSGLSADNFTQSLIELNFKLMMFTAITKYKQVFFLYGLMAAYGFGTDKFDDSYEYDITQLTVALVLGLQIILTTQWALMLQTNVLSYIKWKQKFEGNEVEDSNTFGIINKNSIFAISLVYMFANRRQ